MNSHIFYLCNFHIYLLRYSCQTNKLSSGCRNVFSVDENTYQGHMKSVKQSVLDGTSKWSAKIAITGRVKSYGNKIIRLYRTSNTEEVMFYFS